MRSLHTFVLFALVIPPFSLVHADIFRWDNGELITGTEGIEPAPGVQLDNRQLVYADFVGKELTGSNFETAALDHAAFRAASLMGANFNGATLTHADFAGAELSDASFQGANLTDAHFRFSVLNNANFDDAIIRRGSFRGGADGFTIEHLTATSSYNEKDLAGVSFDLMDFREMDFREYNLANARFFASSLVGSDLRQANLFQAYLEADITNVKLDDAIVKGAGFQSTLSPEQLYSTHSYKEKDLGHISMSIPDDQSWNLSGQNLAGSSLYGDGLKMATIDGSIITGASLDVSAQQLYSTESYTRNDLRGIRLGKDVSGWSFAEQNLTNARFSTFSVESVDVSHADLSGADLTRAHFKRTTLTNTDFTDAVIAGANFANAIDFTASQLYSTASFRQKDIRNVNLSGLDLSGWDFSGQDLSNAYLSATDLTGANLDNANLFGADVRNAIGFSPVDSTILRNVIRTPSEEEIAFFGDDFHGVIDGLELRDGESMIFTRSSFGNSILVKNQLQLSDESVLEFEVTCIIECGSAELHIDEERTPVTLGGTLRVGHGPNSAGPIVNMPIFFKFEDEAFSNTFSSFELPVGKWDVTQLTVTGVIHLVDEYRGDGDLNVDGQLDVHDIDRLTLATRVGRDFSYDLNSDRLVDQQDRVFWIHEFKNTWFGDANLDGEFNTSDLVQVFQAGQYEDDTAMNSGWAEGDWNGDGDFNTSDLVFAFQDGGYEIGPRAQVVAVPEPSSLLFVGLGLVGLWLNRRRQRQFAV